MNPKEFLHQFFSFSQHHWEQIQHIPLQNFFRDELLPRRTLKKSFPKNFTEAECLFQNFKELHWQKGIRTIPFESKLYPLALKEHLGPRAPTLLYLRGQELKSENHYVSIVGTRNPSGFGKIHAANFSHYFTAMKISVVSGLALGIDTIAHRASLKQGTVAVLGGGVDAVYPSENQELAESILSEGGTLLSPFPSAQVPLPFHFPLRNELIAALSTGTIVIEGNVKSGALITGKLALSMGKTVVALTQDFQSPFGQGAIRLQQDGAVLVADEREALQAIFQRMGGFSPAPKQRSFCLEDFQQTIGKPLSESIALLQEGIETGKIEKLGRNTYRLRPNNEEH